jgi:UDP-glucose 4,6-dehydratase
VKWFEDHKWETIRPILVGVLTLADVCREHDIPSIDYAFGGGNFEDRPISTDYFYLEHM